MRHHADREREQRRAPPCRRVLQRHRLPQARAQVAASSAPVPPAVRCGPTADSHRVLLEAAVRDLAVEVRQALAGTVAVSTRSPPCIARQLAGDRPRSLISSSSAARAQRPGSGAGGPDPNADQHALAVAGRAAVSPAGVDALVEIGNAEVVVASGGQCWCAHLQSMHGSGWSRTMRKRSDRYRGHCSLEASLRGGRAAHWRDGERLSGEILSCAGLSARRRER